MLKLVTIALLSLVNAQNLSCFGSSEQTCKYCTFTFTNDLNVGGCVLPGEYSKDIPASEFTDGRVCITNEAVLKNYVSREKSFSVKSTYEYYVGLAK